MQGKVCAGSRTGAGARDYPAYAGKSTEQRATEPVVSDHPRVCGEKAAYFRAECVPRGSPPRMRGKGSVLYIAALGIGITPAYAGKRRRKAPCRATGRDHPRVCGEKMNFATHELASGGSPPRVRGKEKLHGAHGQLWGITPACAGKRRSSTLGYAASGDHPRVCGEKRHLHHLQRLPLGSPPRVRGKVLFPSFLHRLYGITPACAGKS